MRLLKSAVSAVSVLQFNDAKGFFLKQQFSTRCFRCFIAPEPLAPRWPRPALWPLQNIILEQAGYRSSAAEKSDVLRPFRAPPAHYSIGQARRHLFESKPSHRLAVLVRRYRLARGVLKQRREISRQD